MNYLRHPLSFLLEVLPSSRGVVLEFSRYVYRPQSLLDERSVFSVALDSISEDWLMEMLSRLSPNEELAVHSKIYIDGKTFHIPMIDFDCSASELLEAKKVAEKMLTSSVSSTLKFL
ncbi:hypothetical protein [Simiduia agarivorans]|uniref:Uncharacterized protein n=1 Tax=Simiduia agarivorans (strain DSM 21679 / JCM 13881 / BCRC 17597 / SA1) TaxID=1117647 RepID=K4KWU9_SIMAS|nr:hypothetical protein [Simiduia agarivorans]AFU98422.2 hypothetical protein M5M_06135 [Simiduia agarivorans SA1 = DSM 21679]